MARYHDIEGSFWEDFIDRPKNEKILYLFAFTNPLTRDSGMYTISLQTILLNTTLNRKEFEAALKGLHGKLYYDEEQKVIFVAGKLKRRLSGLANNKNMLKAVQHDIDAYSSSVVCSLFVTKYKEALEGLESLSLPLPLPLPLKERGGVGEEIAKKPKEQKKEVKPKVTYADMVDMTKEQYDRLISDYGYQQTQKMISVLSLAKCANDKLIYTSDYHAILKWVVDKIAARKVTPGLKKRVSENTFPARRPDHGQPLTEAQRKQINNI